LGIQVAVPLEPYGAFGIIRSKEPSSDQLRCVAEHAANDSTADGACSPGQTTVYLHLSQRHLHAATNPLDQINIKSFGKTPNSEDNES
jgi:hypothetical protein